MNWPIFFGASGWGAVIGFCVVTLYNSHKALKKDREWAEYRSVLYNASDLYVTCGTCGQVVPSEDGIVVKPHKYTVEAEEGTLRIDCPQGRV